MKLVQRSLVLAGLIGVAISWQAKAICAADTEVSTLSITQSGSTWTYDYSVMNGCDPNHQPLLTDFYVPYFADAQIANITVPGPDDSTDPPTTWTYTIEPNNDLFNLGPDAGVIDFQVTSLADVFDNSGDEQELPGVGYYGASGFTFTSPFAPVEGPWAILQTDFDDGNYDTTSYLFGDPSIPGSPETIAALQGASTPEPGTVALAISGLCLIAPLLRRRS